MLGSRTAKRVEDWHARGLIDAPTARVLLDDIGAAGTGRSFASIAVWLGIVCLAFGAMTFVAANWDAMSRLLRMMVLGTGVLASYGAAGALHRRGNAGRAEAFVVLGCGVFGAAVMLTGQMYHLPGPPSGGVLLWTVGTFVAAVATGGAGALGLAVVLATVWTVTVMTAGSGTPFHPWFVPVWGVLAVCTWWMHARAVAHVGALGALVWAGLSIGILVARDESFTAGYVALMAGFAAVSLAILSARTARVLRGFEREAAVYLTVFVFCLLALLLAATDIVPRAPVSRAVLLAVLPLAVLAVAPVRVVPDRFDHVLAASWVVLTVPLAYAVLHALPYAVEGFALAVSVWTIRMGGRQGWRAVTAIGYTAFAATVVILYVAAAHGLLGTSLFYLGAGALLLTGAMVVPRIVRVREGGR